MHANAHNLLLHGVSFFFALTFFREGTPCLTIFSVIPIFSFVGLQPGSQIVTVNLRIEVAHNNKDDEQGGIGALHQYFLIFSETVTIVIDTAINCIALHVWFWECKSSSSSTLVLIDLLYPIFLNVKFA